MIPSEWKYSLPFLREAQKRWLQKGKTNPAFLNKLNKRIALLDTIHKCSDEIAALLEDSTYLQYLDRLEPSVINRFLEESFTAEERGRISVNVMTYNEERCIKRCLDSVRELADEIIVLDTGSTDRTVEIVREHFPEAKIYQTKWQGDFSQVRNMMIDYSSYDWIFQIDADEYLLDSPLDLRAFVQMFTDFPIQPLVISPIIVNHDQNQFQHSKRIFPKRSGLTYYGLVHEELRFDLSKRGTDLYHVMTQLRLYHDGYTEQVVKEKKKFCRNKALLEQMIQLEPTNIRWYYFLAREKNYLGEDQEEIVQLIQEGIRHKDASPDLDHFHLACLILLASIYKDKGENERLNEVIEEINAHYPYCIDGLFYELSETFEQSLTAILSKANHVWKKLISIDDPLSFIHSEGGHLYRVLGIIHFYRGDYRQAFKFFSQIKDPEELAEIKEQMSILRKELDHFLGRDGQSL